MLAILLCFWALVCQYLVVSDPLANLAFDYPNIKDELYEQPVTLMSPKKSPHDKAGPSEAKTTEPNMDSWAEFDFSKFDSYLNNFKDDAAPEHNRIRRHAKQRRSKGGKRRYKQRLTTSPSEYEGSNSSRTDVPIARIGFVSDLSDSDGERPKKPKGKKPKKYDTYESPSKVYEAGYVEMPKDLYQAHLRPGVIFRIHMSEAVLKMQYRNYGEDKDESVIEADVEYLRLTRKVINDEITKFEDLQWLNGWFLNRSELIQEHMCNTRYYTVGTPPTMFTHSEEYMKRLCLFDGVYIDHIPYVVGEDSSLMAAVAPPVLHCDAATCTSVPFIDSVMFEERYSRTNVRTLTRCQASCRAHCRNDPDCLKRCSDRCLRAD